MIRTDEEEILRWDEKNKKCHLGHATALDNLRPRDLYGSWLLRMSRGTLGFVFDGLSTRMVLDKCHTGAVPSAGDGDENAMSMGGECEGPLWGRTVNFRVSDTLLGKGAEIRCLGGDERSGVVGETQERT